MKVLSLVHYPTFGGPHNRNMRLTPLLKEQGIELIVAIPEEPGNAESRLRAAGAEVITLPLHRARETANPLRQLEFLMSAPPEIRGLERVIRDLGIDVVQINGLVNPHGAFAAKRADVALVWQLLDTRVPASVRRALMLLVTATADVVMTDGPTVARLHPGAERLGDRLIDFLPPVDTEEFRPDAARRLSAREELGVTDEQPLIGTVANLNRQKGHELLIRTVVRLRNQGLKLRCRILGSAAPSQAAYERYLINLAESFGLLDGTLQFTDPGARVAELLPAFDVFVRTSVPRSEGTSTSILEAMSAALPIVSTNVGGIADVVDHEVNGFLVPPLNEAAVGDAIVKLLTDRALHARMASANRQRAVDSFDQRLCLDAHVRAYNAALSTHRSVYIGDSRPKQPERTSSPNQPAHARRLSDLLVCPACRGPVSCNEGYQCLSDSCGRTYPLQDGIPVLLEDPALADHDELEHHRGNQKGSQKRYFDQRLVTEFEVTRPHGSPRLYQWMLGEKFSRSIEGLEATLFGASVLVICGGSGMDAGFLEGAGAHVVTSDISLGCSSRASIRASRFGLTMETLVADAEQLPFRDASFDIVYVHDGLHHLADPYVGLGEMMRVARKAISLTEPAQAAITRAAIRFGLALDYEEAGNRVARLASSEVTGFLTQRGFRPLISQRYAMYYRHEPGRVFGLLSSPLLFPIAVTGWRICDALLGPFGNKFVCTAVREGVAEA